MAWEVRLRDEEIFEALSRSKKKFFSHRRTARILGVSTQPIRDWIRLSHLIPDGPRGQISSDALRRFVEMLVLRAEPYDPDLYLERIYRAGKPAYLFAKLARAAFHWPEGQRSLRPAQLAALAGCHPSLVLNAIKIGRLRARRATSCRWQITKHAWNNAFPLTLIKVGKPRLPALPKAELISSADAADHLRDCGVPGASQLQMRKWIKEGELKALQRTPGHGKFFIKRQSLKDFRQKHKQIS